MNQKRSKKIISTILTEFLLLAIFFKFYAIQRLDVSFQASSIYMMLKI